MLDYFEVHRNGKLHYWESYRNDQFGLRDSFVSGDRAGNLLHVIQYQNIMENGKLAKIITLRNGEICRTVSYGENGKPLLESHAHIFYYGSTLTLKDRIMLTMYFNNIPLDMHAKFTTSSYAYFH